MRLIHLSDVHTWRIERRPWRLLGKTAFATIELLAGRAGRFRLDRLEPLVARIVARKPDHILVTGDLTTTAAVPEFEHARRALAPLLIDRGRVTVIPGNHDRYTWSAVRRRRFEAYFGEFSGTGPYPWTRVLAPGTVLVGLDPTRAGATARGRLPKVQLERLRKLVESLSGKNLRVIVACHYPLAAPPLWAKHLHSKRLLHADEVARALEPLGAHLYCCGHVHAPWAFAPSFPHRQLCLNPGAAVFRDPNGHRHAGFLEVELDQNDVRAVEHLWLDGCWSEVTLANVSGFFGPSPAK